MSFTDLYEAVQLRTGRISTTWVREQVIHLTHITAVKEQWSGALDPDYLRAFYIEGPLGPPIVLQNNEVLVGLSRDMCESKPQGRFWRRFMLTKELMHAFDKDEEKVNTSEQFDDLLRRFKSGVEATPQFRSEVRALWRAISVLCQEQRRVGFREAVQREDMSLEVVASAVHIPTTVVRLMLSVEYDERMDFILDK